MELKEFRMDLQIPITQSDEVYDIGSADFVFWSEAAMKSRMITFCCFIPLKTVILDIWTPWFNMP
jgi:hypothetical protein